MPTLDQRLIDPTPDALLRLLVAATRAADGRLRQRRLDKRRPDWERFLRYNHRRAEGHRRFQGGRGGAPAPRVDVSWWTDPIGRKHWRVVGRRIEPSSPLDAPSGPFGAYALWHVYPDRLMIRDGEPLVVCPCGAAGSPREISWVGERCGPCHDRLEEGLSPLPPAALPATFPLSLPGPSGMVFHRDEYLLTGGYDGALSAWSLDDGACRTLHRRGGMISCCDVSRSGCVAFSSSSGRVLLGNLAGKRWRTIRLHSGFVTELQFSPGGERLLVIGHGESFLLDPNADDGAPTGLATYIYFNWCFLPDGTGGIFADERGVVQLDLKSGEETVLRDLESVEEWQAWENLVDYYFGASDAHRTMDISPDGRWLVIEGAWAASAGLHLSDLRTGQWWPLRQENLPVRPLAVRFTGDGLLAVAEDDGLVRLWNPESGELLGALSLEAPPGWCGPRLFSPSGELLAAADNAGKVRVWPWRRLLGK